MGQTKANIVILILSLFLALLVIVVSSFGLFYRNIYSKETLNWVTQAFGQDLADLFIVTPLLIITSIISSRGNRAALMLWAGSLLYLAYTFAIYCFDLHFNSMFVFYCWIMGLSFYLFLYFLFISLKEPKEEWGIKKIPVKSAGIFILVCGILFYILWLSGIIPAILKNTVPPETIEIGMPTNPVHVLDLSIILPGLILTSILLLKKKKIGIMITPVVLTFFVLMDITIGMLNFFLKMEGMAEDYSVSVIMSVLAVLSLVFLMRFVRNVKSI